MGGPLNAGQRSEKMVASPMLYEDDPSLKSVVLPEL
jgi:hypothetical protein